MSHDEQRLFRRLAVFAGGSLAAAEVVCATDSEPASRQADDGIVAVSVLNGLASLVEKNLLRALVAEDDGAGAEYSRFAMLETMREYRRLDGLAAAGEVGRTCATARVLIPGSR